MQDVGAALEMGDEDRVTAEHRRKRQKLVVVRLFFMFHDETERRARVRADPQPACDRSQVNGALVTEDLLKSSPQRFAAFCRMTQTIFRHYVAHLRSVMAPCAKWGRSLEEKALTFAHHVAHATVENEEAFIFRHAQATIHDGLFDVLTGLLSLQKRFILYPTAEEATVPQAMANSFRFKPFINNGVCLTWDGVFIGAKVEQELMGQYMTRKGKRCCDHVTFVFDVFAGYTAQNVMLAADFSGHVRAVLAGWGGSATDKRVMMNARERGIKKKLPGRFDLGDSGFTLASDMLTPYPNLNYHLSQIRVARKAPVNHKELYNFRHSALRVWSEILNGQLKRRFRLMRSVLEHQSPKTQAKMVVACCVLHNIIREFSGANDDITLDGADPSLAWDDVAAPSSHVALANEPDEDAAAATDETSTGASLRDKIANELWKDYMDFQTRYLSEDVVPRGNSADVQVARERPKTNW
jgi:hypothetical protein